MSAVFSVVKLSHEPPVQGEVFQETRFLLVDYCKIKGKHQEENGF